MFVKNYAKEQFMTEKEYKFQTFIALLSLTNDG